MFVVLDTTYFVGDPHCRSTAWRILAQAQSAWGVSVFVPELVIREAVGGYTRRLGFAQEGLDKWRERHAGPLGLQGVFDGATDELKSAAERYEDELRGALAALSVTILPFPATSHEAVVDRAINRTPPCDAKGDGYRDTLNWLSLLDLAGDQASAHILWVSDNSHDFGDSEGEDSALHPSLRVELTAIGAEDQFDWVRTLPEAILRLAAVHASESGDDLKGIQKQLEYQVLRDHVAELLDVSRGAIPAVPELTGLPLTTREAWVVGVGELSDWDFTVKASLDAGESVVQFRVNAASTIAFGGTGAPPEDSEVLTSPQTQDEYTAAVDKQLTFSGIIQVDELGRPVDGELTRISTNADDPGLAQWALRRAAHRNENFARFIHGDSGPAEAFRNAMKDMQAPGEELRKRMQELQLPGEGLRKMMQQMQLPGEGLRKMMQQMQGPGEELRKMMQQMQGPGEQLRRMLKDMQPPTRKTDGTVTRSEDEPDAPDIDDLPDEDPE